MIFPKLFSDFKTILNFLELKKKLIVKLHHIGIVVSIDSYIEDSFFRFDGKKIYDPIQLSNLCLLKTNNDFFIELIEPLNEKATTYNFLKNNGGGFIIFAIKSRKKT